MGAAINRMQFLRGDFRGVHQPVRPPWALDEARFVAQCTRCGECLAACPNGILVSGRGGFPEVDFSRGECSFCAACVGRCAPRAIDPAQSLPWTWKASITSRCLAVQGIECRSCGDQCETRAIRFRLRVGGPALPNLDTPLCTGCGACIAACPADAVHLTPGVSPGDQSS